MISQNLEGDTGNIKYFRESGSKVKTTRLRPTGASQIYAYVRGSVGLLSSTTLGSVVRLGHFFSCGNYQRLITVLARTLGPQRERN